MGATKRVAELYVQALSQRVAHAVRHGALRQRARLRRQRGPDLPASRSRAGGPVTVTHPEMRRYFMTIPEACQLVLQAGAMGQGGEIFVLDMGEPVKIVDLAARPDPPLGLRAGRGHRDRVHRHPPRREAVRGARPRWRLAPADRRREDLHWRGPSPPLSMSKVIEVLTPHSPMPPKSKRDWPPSCPSTRARPAGGAESTRRPTPAGAE